MVPLIRILQVNAKHGVTVRADSPLGNPSPTKKMTPIIRFTEIFQLFSHLTALE